MELCLCNTMARSGDAKKENLAKFLIQKKILTNK
jgi:hypothetical protein